MPAVTAVVVGAGHSGLAMSSHLAARSIDHVVLERGEVATLVADPALGLPAAADPELDDPACPGVAVRTATTRTASSRPRRSQTSTGYAIESAAHR